MNSVDRIIQLSKFYKENGSLPTKNAKTSLGRTLCKSLYDIRNARIGKGSCLWKEEYIELAISHGLPADLFDDAKFRSDKKLLIAVKAFVDKNGRFPLSSDNASLYSKLSSRRKKKDEGSLNSSTINFALSIGLSEDVFDSNKLNDKFYHKLDGIKVFFDKHGFYPRELSSDDNERYLANCIRAKRSCKAGKGHCVWDDRYLTYAIKIGLPEDIFDSQDKTYREQLDLVSKFYKANGRLPFGNKADRGYWLASVRYSNKLVGYSRFSWLKRYLEYAVSIGLPKDMFEMRKTANA